MRGGANSADTRRPRFRGSIGKLTNPESCGDPRQPVEATRQKVKNSGPLYSVASRLIAGSRPGKREGRSGSPSKSVVPGPHRSRPVYGLACGT